MPFSDGEVVVFDHDKSNYGSDFGIEKPDRTARHTKIAFLQDPFLSLNRGKTVRGKMFTRGVVEFDGRNCV